MKVFNMATRHWLLLLLFLLPGITRAGSIILHNATVFTDPVSSPLETASVVIDAGRIQSVESGDSNGTSAGIDLSGKFVTAGFWNSHVHYLMDPADLQPGNRHNLQDALARTYLRWGFANTIDTGSHPKVLFGIEAAISAGDVMGPAIFKMGGSFVPQGGSPFYIAPVQLPAFTSADQAAEITAEALALGYDGIKLFTGSWGTPTNVVLMQPDHIAASVETAHQQEKLVFAHPSDSDGARLAIEAGVDALAHTFPAELKGRWDRSLPGLMYDKGVSLVPTLKLFRYDLTRLGLPANLVDRLENNAVSQLAAFHELGGRVLFGTDVGYMDDTDTSQEFTLMARAGMNWSAILQSLTTAPAQLLGVSSDQGKVAPGFKGDLVVLNADPRNDITAFSNVHMVIRDGQIVFPQ